MLCTNWWIMASVSFFVSLIMAWCNSIFIGTALGFIFLVLELALVISGWVLWGIGLVTYFRNR